MLVTGPCSPSSSAGAHVIILITAVALQAFVQLGLRLLLHQLQETPTLLSSCTPGGALVPVLGQLLSYSSAVVQVCLEKPQHRCLHALLWPVAPRRSV